MTDPTGRDAPLPPPPPGSTPLAAYPPPPTPPRRRGRLVGIAVAAVAAVAIGASAVVALSADDGAGSPEAAVRAFMERVTDEDLEGAVALLSPDDVGHASELYDLVIRLLQRQGNLGPEGNPLAGVDLDVRGLELDTTELHPDVAKVELTAGTLAVQTDPDEMDPNLVDRDNEEAVDEAVTITRLADELDTAARALRRQLGAEGQDEPLSLFLMAVEVEGSWYVSPTYTLFEYARVLTGLPAPDYAASRSEPGAGARSPAGVVEALVDHLNSFDTEELADALDAAASGDPDPLNAAGLVSPGEIAAFVDYLPLLNQLTEELTVRLEESLPPELRDAPVEPGDAAPSEVAEALRALDGRWQWDVETDTEAMPDGRAKVVLRSGSLELELNGTTPEGEDVSLDLRAELRDGLCIRAEGMAEVDGERTPIDEETCIEPPEGSDALDDGLFVVAVSRDGRWYLSLVETVVEYLRLALEAELDSAD